MSNFANIGNKVGKLVSDKQRAYGDSFGRSGECLRQMFPEAFAHLSCSCPYYTV